MLPELLILIFLIPVFILGSFLVLHALVSLIRHHTAADRGGPDSGHHRFVRSSTIGG
jgi:hypothetical protein